MKIRNGFVSNSSSSSYIIILPDNFRLKTQNNTAKILFDVLKRKGAINENYMEDDVQIEPSDPEDVLYTAWGDLFNILQPYCVFTEETGADMGNTMVIIDNKKIKKMWSKI